MTENSVTFLNNAVESKTLCIGKVYLYGKQIIKYLIRNESDLYSVYESSDNGKSARLLPRLNCNSDEECYHTSIESTKEWINNYESK